MYLIVSKFLYLIFILIGTIENIKEIKPPIINSFCKVFFIYMANFFFCFRERRSLARRPRLSRARSTLENCLLKV